MNNFIYYNPTRIIFGEGTIAKLGDYIPPNATILMCYGGGSIKRNGVYDQVMEALSANEVHEFGGIEPNPDVDTLTKAIEMGREKKVDFLLAVGGGSVIDGVKLISAGIPYLEGEAWDIVTNKIQPEKAIPFGTVLTLPATGSEMNSGSVISRRATQEKLAWGSELTRAVFSILDPTTTYSLPLKQVRNGIVDAYVHVMEQYGTYPVNAAMQDRQAEAVLLSLQEIALKALEIPPDYDARANLMWTATNALNNLINRGVPEDWATHMIGHELTAFYALAHAETLAAVMPHLYRYMHQQKAEKIIQYGRRVWKLAGDDETIISSAIECMEGFFHSLAMPTTLTAHGIDPQEAAERVSARFTDRDVILGERHDITPVDVYEIVKMSK